MTPTAAAVRQERAAVLAYLAPCFSVVGTGEGKLLLTRLIQGIEKGRHVQSEKD